MPVIKIDSSKTYSPRNGEPYIVYKNDMLGAIVSNNNGYAKFCLDKTYASGKYYLEFKIDLNATTNPTLIGVGIKNSAIAFTNTAVDTHDDILINDYRWYYNGIKQVGAPMATPFKTGDIIGLAIDIDNKNIQYYYNGVLKINAAYEAFITRPTIFSVAYCASLTREFTFVVNKKKFKYPIPDGYLPYDGIVERYLIMDKDGVLYTLNSTGNIIQCPSQILDESNYSNNGFLTTLNSDQLNQLKALGALSDFKLLMYTEDVSVTTPILKYNCQSYKLINKINPKFKVLMYKE